MRAGGEESRGDVPHDLSDRLRAKFSTPFIEDRHSAHASRKPSAKELDVMVSKALDVFIGEPSPDTHETSSPDWEAIASLLYMGYAEGRQRFEEAVASRGSASPDTGETV